MAINDATLISLRIVRTPYIQAGRYSPRHSNPEDPWQKNLQQPPAHVPAALTFHSVPESMVVGITLLLRLHCPRKFSQQLAIVCFCACHRQKYGKDDDGGEEEQQEEEEGEEMKIAPVRWEEWNSHSVRVSPLTFY